MTSNVAGRTLAVVGLVLLLLLSAACGGDDDGGSGDSDGTNGAADGDGGGDPAAVAHFKSLETALAEVNGQLEALDELRADAFDEGPNADAADAYGAAYETYMADRVTAIQALEPPESLATQHAALVTAATDTQTLAADLRDALSESPPASQEAFQALFGELDGASITSRYSDACNTLQAEATAGDVDVDLGCLR